MLGAPRGPWLASAPWDSTLFFMSDCWCLFLVSTVDDGRGPWPCPWAYFRTEQELVIAEARCFRYPPTLGSLSWPPINRHVNSPLG